MRRQMAIFAAAALVISITACTPKTDESSTAISIEGTESVPSQSQTDSTIGTDESIENGESADTEGQPVTDELLNQVYEAVKEAYGVNYIPSMMLDRVMLDGQYGIKEDWYETFIAEGPMISAQVETFIAVKAAEGKAADVEKALNDYRENQLEAGIQYPMNLPKLEASQVLTHGDYVFFIMLGSADREAEEQGETEALESAKKNNQIGIDVVNSFFQS